MEKNPLQNAFTRNGDVYIALPTALGIAAHNSKHIGMYIDWNTLTGSPYLAFNWRLNVKDLSNDEPVHTFGISTHPFPWDRIAPISPIPNIDPA